MIEKYEKEHNGNYHRRDILELAHFSTTILVAIKA